MISIERQQKLFLDISRVLTKSVTAYAVGGTAMMFLGLKESTLDIDLVFNDAKNKDIFREAIERLGYRKMDAVKVYGAKKNIPDMLTLGDERFDLFVSDVVYFSFSQAMQKRAIDTNQYGDKLLLKIANPQDIILMKCATDRLKDKDDVLSILSKSVIDWNDVIEEAKNQVRLGKTEAVFHLGCFLEDLKPVAKERIPADVIDRLYDIVKIQINEKQKIARKKDSLN